jgi:molybdopterin-guanine dinucleotide biosynthesis protein A
MPLLHRPILALSEVAGEVLVVRAPGASVPSTPRGVHVRVVHDAEEAQGPLAGVLAGLRAAETELVLVAGGDMPNLVPAVLRELLRTASERGVDAVVLQDADRPRPLPIALRVGPATAAARELLHDGERRLRALPDALHAAVLDEPTWRALDSAGMTLADVDEPGDLPERAR